MKDELIRAALERAVQPEFETPVDLMPRIRSKIAPRQPVIRSRSGLRWAVTALVTLFVAVATVYAISSLLRQALEQDKGLTYVDSQGFGQPLDITTTIDGMILHLEWAYADAERISLGYTVQFPDVVPAEGFFPVTSLIDEDGRVFTQTDSETSAEGTMIGYVQDFTSYGDHAPDTLNLRLVGRFELWHENETQVFAPVNLRFSIPFTAGHRLVQPLTVTAGAIPLTLNQVMVTPSMVNIELCYPLSIDPEGRLQAVWTVNAGSETITADSGTMISLYEKGDQRCSGYRLDVALYDAADTWTITVAELVDQWSGLFADDALYRRYTEGEAWESIYAEMEARGLIRRITGNWIFEFELEGEG